MAKIFSRLRRFHPLAWSAMLLSALPLALIIIAGEYKRLGFEEPAGEWERRCWRLSASTYERHFQLYEHGWPRPFLARVAVEKPAPSGQPHRQRSDPLIRIPSYFSHWGGSSHHGVSWSDYDSWPVTADDWMLDPWSLALDLGAALAIIVVVGGVAQWRITSRGGWLRFGLADLLAALTFAGVLLGVYAHHARLQQVEGQGGGRPLPPAFVNRGLDATFSQNYYGPVWLRKLMGNEYFLPFMHHIDEVGIGLDGRWREAYGQLPRFRYLQSVRVRDGLPTDAIEPLQRCRQLKRMSLTFSSEAQQRTARARPPVLTVDRLSLLAPLKLSSLELSGDQVLAEHVKQAASFPTIRRIALQGVSASAKEIETLRTAHPRVSIVVKPSLPIFRSPG